MPIYQHIFRSDSISLCIALISLKQLKNMTFKARETFQGRLALEIKRRGNPICLKYSNMLSTSLTLATFYLVILNHGQGENINALAINERLMSLAESTHFITNDVISITSFATVFLFSVFSVIFLMMLWYIISSIFIVKPV